MLSHSDLSLLLRADDRRDFLVLDWRGDAPQLHSVFVRAWATNGYVCEHLADATWAPLSEWVAELERGAIVLTAGQQLPSAVQEALGAIPALVRIEERGGRLYRGRQALTDLPSRPVRGGATTLTLQGRNTVMNANVDPPVNFLARPYAAAARSAVRLSGVNPHETLPAPRWYRIPPRGTSGGSVTVRVAIRPRQTGDEWEVTINGQRAEEAVEPPPVTLSLERLGLVFDRTCPDRTAWTAAHVLSFDPELYHQIYDAPTSGDGMPQGEINAGIRAGLTQGLREWEGALQVQLAWVADRDGHGIAAIPGVEWPKTDVGSLGSWSARDLGGPLKQCTYSPGLDLWDPIGKGLEVVAEPLLRQPRTGDAVLIVGNSPPDVPLDRASPFYKILERDGILTTTRRKSDLFPNVVRKLDARGAAIAYLFLVHGSGEPGEESGDEQDLKLLNDYKNLQEKVQQALGEYMPVVVAPADAEGVARGVREALTLLARPEVSGVVVSLPQEGM